MSWIAVALLGGGVGLDATSFPQVMISRPLVAGALTGWLFGRPMDGVLLGALLEIFHLAILPIGAAKYPEAGTATVAATAAWAASPAAQSTAGLLLAIVFALAWERVTGASVIVFRRNVERILFAHGRAAATPREVVRRHFAALGFDALRGAAVALTGGLLGTALLALLTPLWAIDLDITRAVIALATVSLLAAALNIFGGWSVQHRLFLLGTICGAILVILQ